jgi:hypothetical protein
MSELSLDQKLNLLDHHRSETWLWLLRQLANPLIGNSFEELEIEGLDELILGQEKGKQYVLLSDHESEIDWVVLPTLLSKYGVKVALHSGANLFVPIAGYVLKKAGGYMAIRDSHNFRVNGRKVTIGQMEYGRRLLKPQLERILGEDHLHVIAFPGVDDQGKPGRSYSGKYNPFSPLLMKQFMDVVQTIDSDIVFKEVKISYERVPEDTAFREFANMSKRSKIMKNVYDHANTFLISPWQKRVRGIKPKIVVKFGEEHSAEGNPRDIAQAMYEGIGKLQRVYPSHLVFASTDDKYKISKQELEDNINSNVEKLDAHGVDLSGVMDGNTLMGLEEMLRRIEKLFNYKKIPVVATRNYTTIEHDKNEAFIWHPHLARFYSNKLNYVLKPRK